MLKLTQIFGMERALRGRRVLSVFVDTSSTDRGGRATWRADLDLAIARVLADASRLPGGERTALELCLAHVRTELEAAHGPPASPRWVAYATTDDVVLAGAVQGPLQTQVIWQRGLVVAPLLPQLVPEAMADTVAPRPAMIAPPRGHRELQLTAP